jgi:aryl-alcohol dehydrogenase-like predicted oxidoreductase
MKYRVLGSTGLRVSVIGLGTWQLGGEWGRAYTQAEADAIFDRAAELGINLIDTAECYGDHLSESLVGDYLSRHDRGRWIVATKFGHRYNAFLDRTDDFTPEGARLQLEASLRALRVDAIDLYQYHSGPDEPFRDPALWEVLERARRDGKVRHLGVSIRGKGSDVQAREARQRGVDVLQVIYNRLDRRPETEVFPHAERDDLGILARVPLASGFLTGKYHSGVRFPAGDVRASLEPEKVESQIREAQRVRETEVPPGVPMSRWALAWCLRNPRVHSVIPGCKDPAQVEENARAAEQAECGAWEGPAAPRARET